MGSKFCPEWCGGCSCHTGNPPCSHCTDHVCPDCGLHEGDCECDEAEAEKQLIREEFKEKVLKL